ncbi:DUF3486 family protein [Rhodanobacter denitrificans]|nr:DUF3486 family protein [Rhodanobacter denitrificans]
MSVQDALDERLRTTAYAQLDEHREHLTSEGYNISRSALGRHAQALRAADSSLGDRRARVAEIKAKPKGKRDDLLMELGRLQLAQSRILMQLHALEESGIDADDDALVEGMNTTAA